MITFDEWFKFNEHDEAHRQLMEAGWKGAMNVLGAEFGAKLMKADAGFTLGDALRWELEKRVVDAWPPAVNDIWLVKVRGGQIESLVVVESVNATEIWVVDPPNVRHNRKFISTHPRRHLIENLEFIKLIERGSK